MKIAIVATLIASASAFSVNKAAFTQVRMAKVESQSMKK
jgi:hypothetical protein